MSRYHFDNLYAGDPMPLGGIELLQLGEMLCDAETVIPPHLHLGWYEFTYVLAGAGTVSANGVQTAVKKGDLFFSHENDLHAITPDPRHPLRYFFMSFFVKKDTPCAARLSQMAAATAPNEHRAFHADDLAPIFTDLLSVVRGESDLDREILAAGCELAILKAAKVISAEPTAVYRPPKEDRVRALCAEAVHYVDRHVRDIRQASEVAHALSYDVSYLSRCFTRVLGISLYAFLTQRKMEEAERLLRESDRSVTEIAELLNYSSIYVFTRTFRRFAGVTPLAYRAANG